MPFLKARSASIQEPPQKKQLNGFSSKLKQPFWRSRSKNSIGSESQGSISTISGLGGFPTFTPDSSLSIYTNSLDSDCSASSTTSNSNQVSPSQNSLPKKMKKPNSLALDDQISSFSYSNDCERYAANMYYDVGSSNSFEWRVPIGVGTIDRSINTSVPLTPPFEEDDGVHSYYNNNTFSTFPNPRRHSVAYSSYSSSLTSRGSSTKQEEMIELVPLTCDLGPDGYLTPLSANSKKPKTIVQQQQPRPSNSKQKSIYINDSQSVLYTNEVVRVEVHTSGPPDNSGARSKLESSLGSSSKDSHRQQQASNDSDSATTIVQTTTTTDQAQSSNDKALPLYMSRILLTSSDCEPFCSLCATSAAITASKSSSMDVAVVSCQECFFSRIAESHIREFFERMVTPDNQKIDIALQAYDLKDLDHHAVAAEVHRAKVQIVIISNHFLERLRHEASSRKKLSPVNRVLRSKRVIAVITGTTSTEISEGYQAVLARFDEWFAVELRSATKVDAEFCKKFTDQVVKIYNVELNSTSNFSVFPKKVTREQPKIVLMFKKPVQTGDSIKVDLTRGRDTDTVEVTTTNPYTAIIRIPESLCAGKTALLEITLHVNKQKLGTKLVKYEYNAKHSEDDVIERMSKAVPGFKKLLDDHISQTLSKNFRACTDWSLDPDLELLNDVLISKGDDFPTIMHFSAYYGLEQTVWTLLDEADGFEQCSLKNDVNETPLDIAQGNIGQIIKDYQEMTMSWKAFQYVKDLVGRNSHEFSGEGPAVPIISTTDVEPRDTTTELFYTELETLNESGDSDNESPVESNEVNGNEAVTTNDGVYVNTLIDDSKPSVEETPVLVRPTVRTRVNVGKAGKRLTMPSSSSYYVNLKPLELKSSSNSAQKQFPQYTDIPDAPPLPDVKFKPQTPTNLLQNYDVPRKIEETYKIPPSDTRPALPEKKMNQAPTSSDGYIVMKPPGGSCESKSNSPLGSILSIPESIHLMSDGNMPNGKEKACSTNDLPSIVTYPTPSHSNNTSTANLGPAPMPIKLDPTDEDLFELMNDFKNNVYSMRQLELLFEHWKRRTDVKLSYEERHDRLKKMREEYKHIQEEMKRTRRPSVIAKVFGFFNGSRKKVSVPGPPLSEGDTSELDSQSLSLAPAQRELSVSVGSDRGSCGSSNNSGGSSAMDSGVSDTEQGSEREKQPAVWVSPLDRKCVTVSYIAPSSSTLPSGHPLALLTEGSSPAASPCHKGPPPPRPVKTKTPTSPCSPTAIAFIPPPISPPTTSKLKNTAKRDIFGRDKDSPPPPPPPRNVKNSPFSLVNYDKRNQESTSTTANGTTPLTQNKHPYVNTPGK